MSGLNTQLAQQIDQVLSGGSEAPVQSIEALFASVSEFLRQPVSHDLREAAKKVSQTPATSADQFRGALMALKNAIESQEAQDSSAAQFANDPELVQEFLVEAREHLSNVENGMLTLEQEPDNAEALNAVFRSFHTIKGLAGFLGAMAIHELAHETENVLDLARSGNLTLSVGIIDVILKSADELNHCLDRAGSESLASQPRCDEALLNAIASIAKGEFQETSKPEAKSSAAPAAVAVQDADALAPSAAERAVTAKNSAENSVVRIDTAKLEYLIDMVGELVIAESVVRHDPAIVASKDPLLSRNLTQLARVVQEVQKTSMSMRMVAVGTLFRKMSRLTRDLARKSGKLIELVTFGDDVELDRSIVEDLADPMVHMIRNSVDHGLEPPEERLAAGKTEKGTIRLQATHDAGDIVLEIGDDGRGMNPERILSKARRLGLVGELEQLDEDAIFRLIFEAGFSTVDKVTDMSGRGVGMDVVKKQIQKLRGRIAIKSVPGKGCTFVLRLPLTLAIIDGLVVSVGSQRFILPMFAVREMFSPKPDTFVTLENRAEAALFRDKLLPLIRLSKLFGEKPDESNSGVLIVAEGRDQLYCIAVDQLIGKQEVVIKSLGKTFRDVPAITGGAILGDGRVGLIVDVNSLKYQN